MSTLRPPVGIVSLRMPVEPESSWLGAVALVEPVIPLRAAEPAPKRSRRISRSTRGDRLHNRGER